MARGDDLENRRITRRETAERLGISERSVDRLIRQGRLRAYRLGTRSVRINLSDLESLTTQIPTSNPHDAA